MTLRLTVAFFLVGTFACLGQSPSPKPFSELHLDWTDTIRNRPVPVKIYLPSKTSGFFPVIIFSHGLGGSRDGYAYLGSYWAEHGFVSVHLQHIGSDDALWKSTSAMVNLQKAILDPQNALNRPRDVSFAIDQLTLLNEDKSSELYHKLDLKNIGMAGHSFGAFTTLAVAGETFGGQVAPDIKLADPRIKAAIEMSAPALRPGMDPAKCYGSIQMPFLHITGTEDKIPAFLSLKDKGVEDRRVPYDSIPGPHQYLVIYQDADHMVFSGFRLGSAHSQDAGIQASVCQVTTTFWDAWLKSDPLKKKELEDGETRKSLEKIATFESK